MQQSSEHPPLKAIAFDLDGTLIDSTNAIVASYQHVFGHFGMPRPTPEEIIGSIGHPLPIQLGMMGMADVDAAIAVYKPYYASIAGEHTVLLPGAEKMLAAIAALGLRVGLATSKQLDAAELLLEHLGVRDHFHACVGPREVTNPKPHPEPILLTAQLLGVAPEEMVYIGDMHFDVLSARAAGSRCIALTTGYATRAELETLDAEVVLDSLDEAWAHLERTSQFIGV